MPVESVSYAELGIRLSISPKAARALAKRLRLPRSLSDDGKALVSVDIAELRHAPRPPRRRKGHLVLAAKVLALEAEIERLEATAAGHRADFERERERADQLMVELLQTARAAQEPTTRLEGLLRANGRPVGSTDSHGLGQRQPAPLAAHLVAADRRAIGRGR
jgi:hypothetical protein